MKKFRIIMDMPVIIEVVDPQVTEKIFEEVFNYFTYIDNTFSPFKKDSELTKINQGRLQKNEWSQDMKTVFKLCEQTSAETLGYFNIEKNRQFDPLGLVKGWAINNAANILKTKGFKNYYVEAGGDIQVNGKNKENKLWRIGIQNPFNLKQNVKIVTLSNQGIATSGTYLRGQHIRNPFAPKKEISDIISLTVIGPNIYEADRFATAAFTMGKKSITFIENLKGFAGYIIDNKGMATFTSNFNNFVFKNDKPN
jgi:thiamine biosynthesis lipoprotein